VATARNSKIYNDFLIIITIIITIIIMIIILDERKNKTQTTLHSFTIIA